MSKYIQIKDQVFKIPDKITIGRGEPFTVLNDDRDVSRAHTILAFRNSKWYLKNLNDSDTTINGSKTKSKKYVEVHLHDEIFLGKSKIQLLETAPATSYITIKRSTNDLSKDLSLLIVKTLFLLFFILGVFVLASSKKLSIQTIIISSSIVGIFFATIYYFLKRYTKKMTPQEVIVAKDGFSVHFHNDENMTFKRDDIDFWTMWPWVKSVIIVAKQREIFISIKDHKFVLEFLENHLSHKRGSTPWWRLGVVALSLPYVLLETSDYPLHLVSLCLLGISGMIALYCGLKYEKGRKQRWFIISTGLYALLVSVVNYNPEPVFRAVVLQEKCTDGDIDSCKSINFHALMRDSHNAYDLNPKALSNACENKNQSACHYLKEKENFREIAGKKL